MRDFATQLLGGAGLALLVAGAKTERASRRKLGSGIALVVAIIRNIDIIVAFNSWSRKGHNENEGVVGSGAHALRDGGGLCAWGDCGGLVGVRDHRSCAAPDAWAARARRQETSMDGCEPFAGPA